MKILIEESVLRQALEAYDHINETGLKPSVCAGVQRAFHALRTALDAAEKVAPVMDFDTYRLQIKEAWESGFRCGLREASPEEAPAGPELGADKEEA